MNRGIADCRQYFWQSALSYAALPGMHYRHFGAQYCDIRQSRPIAELQRTVDHGHRWPCTCKYTGVCAAIKDYAIMLLSWQVEDNTSIRWPVINVTIYRLNMRV